MKKGQCKMQTADYCSDRHEQHGRTVVFLQLCGNLPPNLCNILVLHFSGKPCMAAEQVSLQFLEAGKCITQVNVNFSSS